MRGEAQEEKSEVGSERPEQATGRTLDSPIRKMSSGISICTHRKIILPAVWTADGIQ